MEALENLPRRVTSATSPSNTACRGRDLSAARRPEEAMKNVNAQSATPARVPHRLGRRIRKREARAGAIAAHRAHHRPGHFSYSLHYVSLGEVGPAHSRHRRDGQLRRPAFPADHGERLQRILRCRFPGAVRRFRSKWRDHARMYQSAPCRRLLHRGIGYRGSRSPLAADHDDHAGRDAGPAARGAFTRHRLGFAAPVRHRHRGRPDRQFGHELHFSCPPSNVWLAGPHDKLPEPEESFET